MSDINLNSCRICIINKGVIAINDNIKDTTYCCIIKNFSNIDPTDPLLPNHICQDCATKIGNVYILKLLTEESDIKLKNVFNKNRYNSETENTNDKFYINEEENEVYESNLSDRDDSDIEEKQNVQINTNNQEENRSSEKESDKTFLKKKEGKNKDSTSDKLNRTCNICGKIFSQVASLKNHIRIHKGEKRFECNICCKKFNRRSNLSSHIKTHSDEKGFICEVCSKQFLTNLQLKQHVVIHLPDSAKQYKCSKCPRAFHANRHLKNHLAVHEGNKTFTCADCGKGFISKCYLNRHIKTVHLSIKTHICLVCGKAFSNSGNLSAHFRTHTGEKPYECKYCDAKFNQSTPHVRHNQMHIKRGDKLPKTETSL